MSSQHFSKGGTRVVDHCMGWDEIVTQIQTENFAAFGRLAADAEVYDASLARMKAECRGIFKKYVIS